MDADKEVSSGKNRLEANSLVRDALQSSEPYQNH